MVGCLFIAACSHPDREALEYLKRGQADLARGEAQLAQAELQRAVELAPQSAAARFLSARAAEALGEQQKAQELYLLAIDVAPSLTPAYVNLGRLYIVDGTPERAVDLLQPALLQNPNDPDLLAVRAAARERLNEHGFALQDAEQALRIAPHNPNTVVLLAALYRADGRSAKAVGLLESTYRMAPGLPHVGVALAQIYAAQRRFEDANQLLGGILRDHPHDDEALTLRAELALSRYDAAAALTDLSEVIRDAPTDVHALELKARAERLNGDASHGEQSLRAAIAQSPTNGALRIELANALVQQHRLPEATAELTQAVKAAPRDVAIRRAVVRTDLLAGNAGAAQQALQELDALAPSDPADLFLAGLVAEAEHREADAAMAYDEMLSSNAEAPEALTAWARVELAQGHQVAARMRVLAYTRFSPMNAEALGLLGELYLAQANYAQAIQSLTRAIQLAPTLASAYRALAAAQLRQGNPSAATNTYERAVAAIGPEPGLVSELAALDERQGRIENALSLYEDLVRRLPGQTVAARNLALLLCRYRRDPVSLDRALQLTASFATSGNPTLVDAAGWVHFKRNETQQALTDLERAATLAPNERVIQYHLGMVQLQAGQRDLARASLKAALAGAARFVGIDQARATLRELDSH